VSVIETQRQESRHAGNQKIQPPTAAEHNSAVRKYRHAGVEKESGDDIDGAYIRKTGRRVISSPARICIPHSTQVRPAAEPRKKCTVQSFVRAEVVRVSSVPVVCSQKMAGLEVPGEYAAAEGSHVCSAEKCSREMAGRGSCAGRVAGRKVSFQSSEEVR